jgi:hypothetical protein
MGMSLDTLRAMRMNHRRPARVFVIIGQAPQGLSDEPDTVVIRANDNPRLMDFRPLIRLPVNVIDSGSHDALMDLTLDAVSAAGGRIEGIAGSAGIVGENPEHERLLKNFKEVLHG